MRTRRSVLLPLLPILAISSSCSRHVLVPAPDYAAMEPCPAGGYRVRTTDRREYVVKCLTAADSVFVVRELKIGPEAGQRPVPFELRYSEIDTIERIERTFIVPIVLGAAVVFVVIQWRKFRIESNT